MADIGEVHMMLGELTATVKGLVEDQKEDRAESSRHREELRKSVGQLERQVLAIDGKVTPIIETVATHTKTLELHSDEIRENKLFRTKWSAMAAGLGLLATSFFSGLIWAVTQFWQDIKGLFFHHAP